MHQIRHTAKEITQSTPAGGATISTTATRLFTEIKQGSVVHLANNHASQVIYGKFEVVGTISSTITSTNWDFKLDAGETQQFQMQSPHPTNADKTIEIWILGSGASTTYNAKRFM